MWSVWFSSLKWRWPWNISFILYWSHLVASRMPCLKNGANKHARKKKRVPHAVTMVTITQTRRHACILFTVLLFSRHSLVPNSAFTFNMHFIVIKVKYHHFLHSFPIFFPPLFFTLKLRRADEAQDDGLLMQKVLQNCSFKRCHCD